MTISEQEEIYHAAETSVFVLSVIIRSIAFYLRTVGIGPLLTHTTLENTFPVLAAAALDLIDLEHREYMLYFLLFHWFKYLSATEEKHPDSEETL